ncbi:hypothetical protein OHR68_25000 [Spirillospora sp. NBC_00431]
MGHRVRLRVIGGMVLAMGAIYGIGSAILLFVGGLVGAAGLLAGGYLLIHAAKYEGRRAAAIALAGVAVMAVLLPLVALFPKPG